MCSVQDLRYDIPCGPPPSAGDTVVVHVPEESDTGYAEQWVPATVVRTRPRNFLARSEDGRTWVFTTTRWIERHSPGLGWPVTAWRPDQRDEVSRRAAAWDALEALDIHIPPHVAARVGIRAMEEFRTAVSGGHR